MNTERQPIADRLKQTRQRLGISSSDLALYAGISEDYLLLVEEGTAVLSTEALSSLATALKVDLSWLASGSEAEAHGAGPEAEAAGAEVAAGVPMLLSPAEAHLIRMYRGQVQGISVSTERPTPHRAQPATLDSPAAFMPLSMLLSPAPSYPRTPPQGTITGIFSNTGDARSLLSHLTADELARMWAWSRERAAQGEDASLLRWLGWVEVMQRRYPGQLAAGDSDNSTASCE